MNEELDLTGLESRLREILALKSLPRSGWLQLEYSRRGTGPAILNALISPDSQRERTPIRVSMELHRSIRDCTSTAVQYSPRSTRHSRGYISAATDPQAAGRSSTIGRRLSPSWYSAQRVLPRVPTCPAAQHEAERRARSLAIALAAQRRPSYSPACVPCKPRSACDLQDPGVAGAR